MRVINVNKCYGEKVVLSDFSASFTEGKITAIMGPSGCGKTTLLRLLLGLEKPDSGEILLPQGKVTAVFQEDRLSEPLSAVANIRLVCPAMTHTVARDLLLALGFKEEDCGKPVSTLSGGMRRRVAIARALAPNPDAVILDEPFSALDAMTKSAMHKWYLSVMEDISLPTLFITHDIDEAILLSDRIYLLKGSPGKIAAEIIIAEPKPRREDFPLSAEFLAYKKRILSLL